MPFDGCSADCQNEPNCKGDACILTCGDGIVFDDEECDDGNNLDGDGCSKDCKVEAGYVCPVAGQACKIKEYCGDGVVDLGSGSTSRVQGSPDSHQISRWGGSAARSAITPMRRL